MTKRLSEEELKHLERVFKDKSESMWIAIHLLLAEVRASRKAASVVKAALNKIEIGDYDLHWNQGHPNTPPTLARETLANPDVISWMGGEV